jgi:hypothetical protein
MSSRELSRTSSHGRNQSSFILKELGFIPKNGRLAHCRVSASASVDRMHQLIDKFPLLQEP